MQSGNNSMSAGLVLLFLLAHFFLLAGILIRIVWQGIAARVRSSADPSCHSTWKKGPGGGL